MTSMKRNVIHGDFNTDVSKTMRCDVDVTVIDLILVSDADKISQSGVLDLGISDVLNLPLAAITQ